MMALIDRAVGPLDQSRRWLWREAVRVPALRYVLSRRDVRVPVLISLHALIALSFAIVAPAWSLVLVPLVLGVPHVAADVRYLVLRRRLPRWWVLAIGAFAIGMFAVRLLWELRLPIVPAMLAEHVLGSAWLLTGAIAGAATFGLSSRAMAAVAGAVGVSAFALGAPQAFRLGLLHAHNLIALAVWLLLFRRGLRLVWLPIVIVLGAAAVLASGMTLHWTMRHGFTTLLGLPIFEVADWIAPGLSTEGALALTLLFAFLQSVHYAVWLVAIPQDDARAAASPNYRMKVRALRKDFGVVGLALVLGSMLLMAAASPWSPLYARSLYLSLATFHFWLELATLAFFGARDSA